MYGLLVHFIKAIDRIPTRFNVSIMLFMACLISYMLRVNMSVNILAMVQPIQSNIKQSAPLDHNNISDGATNQTMIENSKVPDYGPRYNWSSHDQSIILGAYFYGYLISSLPAGIFAERFGGRNMVGLSLAFSALLTALTPLAADNGMWATIANRVALGILGGFLYPALHNLISKWAPPDEKGKFVSALMGGTFGTVITWPLVGVLIETLGWSFAFYIPAVISAIVAVLWYIIVADSPSTHPRIKAEEKDYIEKSLGDTISKSKLLPPIASLATSPPFLALLVLHFGNLWGLYFLITAAPKFMSEVLGFKLAKAGFLAALPYLARSLAAFLFGTVGDLLRKNSIMRVTAIRKSFCLFSHIIPGLFLVGLIYIGFDPYVCVAIITLSLGFNGASTMTNLQNSQDLAPNFAGTLYGIINFVGTSSGFISPILVAHFTVQQSTMEEWQYVFIIGAAAYIVPALIFIVFGSGQVQKWNEPKQTQANAEFQHT
ncbi:sialin-like [Anopheles merus]|uniref:sialin-like n=1 Tax=Anopheles merus TaxID=30066 RepID=UPI001BE46901|nr:sialin-like [Anopheles merus]XP_041783949.1 sialin-like [Anopheles merus]XP_041783950.1 sialin-like [Anopheles merus]XP_041783951.1 sialin-like [Anopheles merus]XP_041783952.1 sialin-like [Anopheles merus]XP_041787383.1 sialin-like [Anopheles merus]XP_041787384.1 sialin-like [Anopheles merus]XP_041787385.1 sialin-like [Anopheles merus]XP_041787386.1 sialin-like [Anopheles merus]XP_041787387.1 sialin-like [Anopheles merus]